MKQIYINFCLILLMIGSSLNGFSQTKIASFYHTPTATLAGQDNPISASAKTADINTVTLSRGPGITYVNNSTLSYIGGFSMNETKEQAETSGSYFQIAVTAEAGKYLSFSTLNARLRTGTAQSVTNYRWKYSVDNLSASAFKSIGSADRTIGLTDTQGEDRSEDVSDIVGLQSIAPGKVVYFRLYAWGATTSGSNASFGFGKSNTSEREVLSLIASVTNKPLLLNWGFYAIAPGPSANATIKNPGLNTSTLTRGTGLTETTFTRSFTAYSPNLSASYAESVTNNEYYSFNINPKANAKVNISDLNFKYRRKAAGANNYQWAYIKDGGLLTIISGATGLITAADDGFSPPSTNVSGVVDLQNLINVNAVELRLYVWGATDVTSLFGIGRDVVAEESSLTISGTVEDITPLPVTLTSFSAKKELNSIKLSWRTLSEKNNSHFEVYKTGDVKPNVLLGTVSGAGDSSTANNYSLSDYEPFNGYNYYLLRQVDKNGKSEDFDIISINNVANPNSQLKAYQNDSSVELSAQGLMAGVAVLQVIDVNGRVIYKQSVASSSGNVSVNIPFTSNTKGVYIATLTNNNKVLTAKFIW